MLQDSAFTGGRIVMPQTPGDLLPAAAWSDSPLVRVLIAISVFLLLIALLDIIRLLPDIIEAVSRWKGNVNLEHNLSIARNRDRIAYAFFIPFCLICDRFGFYTPRFLAFIPEGYTVLGVLGAWLVYLLLRWLLFFFWHPSGVDHDHRMAAHRNLFNKFIFFNILMLLTVGIFALTGASEGTFRLILLAETGLIFLLSWIHTVQILNTRCAGLSTFLYLCALEFAPAALLVISALLL